MINKPSDIFEVGTIRNSLQLAKKNYKPKFSTVEIACPYRLNAMALDPSKIVPNQEYKYTPGEIVFSIKMYRKVKAEVRNDKEIRVYGNTLRPQLVHHGALLVLKALKTDIGINIYIQEDEEKKHCGFGSSSGLISATAIAINELFGNPIPKKDLIRYLAVNHGEEIDGSIRHLQHVQCIGGGAAASLIDAGLIIIAGQSTVIGKSKIDHKLRLVIGVPKINPTEKTSRDAKDLMMLEKRAIHEFIETGRKYGGKIAYRMVHEVLPDIIDGKLRSLSDLIYDYRFKYGSIKNCSFSFKGLQNLAENLAFLYEERLVDLLSLSSVGPAFFALTTQADLCKQVFENNNMQVYVTRINNTGYKVINRL